MWRFALILAGAVVGIGLLAWPGIPQDRTPQPNPSATGEDKQVRTILAAEDWSGATSGYRALFKATSAEGLRRLQMNASDTIALQAAWEQVERTMPAKPDRAARPDREKLAWFLGFLEGRVRVQTPQWWADVVLDSHANSQGKVYPGNPKTWAYHNAGLDDLCAPPDTTVKQEHGRFLLVVGKQAVTIPESVLRRASSGRVCGNISGLITPQRCYVAVHDDFGFAYPLTCIDRKSTKVVWNTKAWGDFWGTVAGFGHSYVTVTEQDNHVVVFGASSSGIHVEAFQAEDGRNVFRFANSYSRRE
jgi:hypothetical protein